ncbi:MAG TPA: hypothetical protein VGJ20_36135 [Xanthobacteraceae bacterium]
MRHPLFTAAALLLGCNTCLAQVSTMGSTAMGLPSTPGAIVTSPLNGPSPFSATTQPGTADTTLAPVPLASDPTTPGASINCSSVSAQTTSSLPTQTTSSAPVTAGPTPSGAPSQSALGSPPGTIVPLGTMLPQGTIVILPQGTIEPPGTIIVTPGTLTTQGTTVASTTSTSTTAAIPLGPSAMNSTSISGSTTGTISPLALLGSQSITVCSSTPGGPPTNGAALPLSTPDIPNSPPPGAIQPAVAQVGDTSIDPSAAVIPTPNSAACSESVSMNLANPGMMPPANATGAAATPGVSPPGC